MDDIDMQQEAEERLMRRLHAIEQESQHHARIFSAKGKFKRCQVIGCRRKAIQDENFCAHHATNHHALNITKPTGAFVRHKIIKGKIYNYLVKNQRSNSGIHQKVLKYLGPLI